MIRGPVLTGIPDQIIPVGQEEGLDTGAEVTDVRRISLCVAI
jgi:hypothetical protein